MQVTETLSDGLKRGFTVVLPAADIETKRMERLTSLGKTLRLPGFRPGKVPLPIVRQRYGTAVSAEVLEELVSEATRQVLTERGLRPAIQPKVDLVDAVAATSAAASDVEFKVELELLPDIVLPDFSAIALTRLKAEVTPDRIDTILAGLAERNRDLVDISTDELDSRAEGPGAANDDVLTIDYVGKVDGTEFPGGTGTDMDVTIGGSGFIPGFAEQLAGMRPGDARTIEVTFPAEYGSAELAGKVATFDVTAKRLRKPVVGEPDTALAEKLGFDTLDALRDVIVATTQREYDAVSRSRLKRQLLDELARIADFACPQTMVDQEFDQIWQRLQADRQAGRMDEGDREKDDETLRAEYRAIAERRVRLGLLLAEIARLNNLTVSQEELTAAMRNEVARYPGQHAEMMEILRKYPEAVNSLRGPILEEKVIDFVLELARLSDQIVSPEELATDPEAEGGSAAAAGDAASGDAAPGNAAPGDAAPNDAASGDAAPGDAAPRDAASGDAAPGDTNAGGKTETAA
jgi:trigger factor